MPSAPGRFVWHDLMTTDAEASLELLTGLFGLGIVAHQVAEEMSYLILTAPGSDEPVFGCVPIEAEQGQRSHWIAYLTVADFAAALERVDELGGAVHVSSEPDGDEEVEESELSALVAGAVAIATDPQGAVFAPYGPDEEVAERDGLAPVGRIAWYELMAADPASAAAFYRDLVGIEVGDPVDRGEQGPALPLSRAGRVFGLVRNRLPGSPFPPHWSLYFRVEDLDATIAKARELGGYIYEDPAPLDAGRRATLLDPSGAPIGIWQPG